MKIRYVCLAALPILVLAALPAAAQSVVGSKHDLRATGGGTATGTGLVQVCVVCHTPHQPTTAGGQDPLWNHTVSSAANYGVYASSTLNAVPTNFGGGSTPGTLNISQLCMSCHDGTVSVLSMYKQPVLGGTPTVAAISNRITAAGLVDPGSSAFIGTSLSDDHPVNFTYDAALATADGGLTTPASTSQVVAGVPLFSGTVQCASCHNPHNSTNTPFLRLSNSGSALCLQCHVK